MGEYVADSVVLMLTKRGMPVGGARILVLGLAFKADVPDLRNTRAVDIVRRLEDYGARVDAADPWVDPHEANREYGVSVVGLDGASHQYEAIVVAVGHRQFAGMSANLRDLLQPRGVVFDVTGTFPRDAVDARL